MEKIRKVAGPHKAKHTSPYRLLLAVTGAIFAVELFIRPLLTGAPSSTQPAEALIDSSFLILPVFSFLYFFIYNPLVRQIGECARTEEKLRRLTVKMEAKVRSSMEQLTRSEAEHRSVLQSSPDVIMRIDLTGTIKSVNRAVYRIFGYREKELIGKNLSILISEELPHILADGYISSLDEWSGEISQHSSEVKTRAKDGRNISIELSISECVIESNFYYVIIMRDITEHKRTEEALKEKKALKEREELYRQMFRKNQAVKLLIDPESGLIVDANKAACDFYGYTSDDVTKKKIWDICNLPRKDVLKKMKILKSGNDTHAHFEHRLASGEVRDVEVHSSPIMVGGKKMLFSIIHDITERKRTEKKLKVHAQSMEKALHRADDVLKSLSNPPKPVPYFVTSPLYKVAHTTGGGDSLRWIDFSEKYAGVYLHDVAGHGIQETLLNILATAAVDAHKFNQGLKAVSTPSIFLNEMNAHMLDFCKKTEHYLTAVYLLMDFEKREIKLSLAGHPTPWLISPIKPAQKVGTPGILLGIFDFDQDMDCQYVDTTINLQPGETLLVYSDGLMEQENKSSVPFEVTFKEEVLPQLAGLNPTEAYRLLKCMFEGHLDGKHPDDDVSFVFVGARPEKNYETFEFTLTNSLASTLKERAVTIKPAGFNGTLPRVFPLKEYEQPACARVNNVAEAYDPIVDKLRKADWPDKRINEVRLVLGEMLLNALMHGNLCSDKHVVRLSHTLHEGMLEVCVGDEGWGFEGYNLPQVFDDNEIMKESGRGLHLVRRYADEVYFNHRGNMIWALFSPAVVNGRAATPRFQTITPPHPTLKAHENLISLKSNIYDA